MIQIPQRAAPTVPGLTIEQIRDVVGEAVDQKLADLHRSVGDTAVRAAAGTFVAARLAGVQGMLHAVAALVAIKLLRMAALIGAFVLAVMALEIGTYQSGGVLIGYGLVAGLLVWMKGKPDAS